MLWEPETQGGPPSGRYWGCTKTSTDHEGEPVGSILGDGKSGAKGDLAELLKVDENAIKSHLDKIVVGSVEETLNTLLDAEADELCNAKRYERTPDRVDTRAGSYTRKLQTKAGEVSLKVPKLRRLTFETAIIERYRRRESSVEEALMEMYLAGVSVRRVEDITEALWGTRVSAGTVSDLNQKLYERIDEWLSRPIKGSCPYVYLDGIWLKRCWGGEVRNVAILVAVGVNEFGFREVLAVQEGAKEDSESWRHFLRHLKERGLEGVKLVVSDKSLGLVDVLPEFFPQARWQRCAVHFYRNIFTNVPKSRLKEVAKMLKAIHAQEGRQEAQEKANAVAAKLETLKLKKAAKTLREGVEETFSYYAFPPEHWRHIRTNNMLERTFREIRRRTRAVGAFPDGRSALMLAAARLRHVTGTKWGTRRYLNPAHLKAEEGQEEQKAA